MRHLLDFDHDMDRLLQKVDELQARPRVSSRDRYFEIALAVRLARGEGADSAARGAKEDADAVLRVRREEREREDAAHRACMERAAEGELVRQGWSRDGGKWQREGDPKEYTFMEARFTSVQEFLRGKLR